MKSSSWRPSWCSMCMCVCVSFLFPYFFAFFHFFFVTKESILCVAWEALSKVLWQRPDVMVECSSCQQHKRHGVCVCVIYSHELWHERTRDTFSLFFFYLSCPIDGERNVKPGDIEKRNIIEKIWKAIRVINLRLLFFLLPLVRSNAPWKMFNTLNRHTKPPRSLMPRICCRMFAGRRLADAYMFEKCLSFQCDSCSRIEISMHILAILAPHQKY